MKCLAAITLLIPSAVVLSASTAQAQCCGVGVGVYYSPPPVYYYAPAPQYSTYYGPYISTQRPVYTYSYPVQRYSVTVRRGSGYNYIYRRTHRYRRR